MPVHSRVGRIATSCLFALGASALFAIWFASPEGLLQPSPAEPAEEKSAAVLAQEQFGEDGVEALTLFGPEAEWCLREQPESFQSLVDVVRLDSDRQALATGPFHRAVLDWAQAGTLPRFLEILKAVPDDRIQTTRRLPEALPLLADVRLPTVHGVLASPYGERAWPLFAPFDFRTDHTGVEQLAKAVDREPEQVLRLADEGGLPSALLLVTPETDNVQLRQFPEIVRHTLQIIQDRPLAVAFLFAQQDAIWKLLETGRSAKDMKDAITRFATLTLVEQEIAADHPHTIRLLAETWQGQALGIKVLRKCGPKAADVIYRYYDDNDASRQAVLVGLSHTGFQCLPLVEDQHRNGRFRDVLKRAEKDGLLNPNDNPPLIATAFEHMRTGGRDKIEVYARVENLAGQVQDDGRVPAPEEQLLEWVPGYMAYRTAMNWKDGHHVTQGEAFLATVDGVTTPLMVYGLATSAGKMLAKKAGEEVIEKTGAQAARKALIEAPESVVSRMRSKVRSEMNLGKRFGKDADAVADARLNSRSGGLENLGLADRQAEYLKVANAGDINGKARLVEEIGDAGAKEYAKRARYEPIFQAPPGRGRGFDHVYRDGDRVIVVEAKGGSSPTRTYYGHEQGTREYAQEVAERTLKNPAATADEKQAAEQVLTAARENWLDVEVVRTEHVQGRPTRTFVERDTAWARSAVTDDLRNALVQVPGVTAAFFRHTTPRSVLPIPTTIRAAERSAKRIGLTLWPLGPEGPFTFRQVKRFGKVVKLHQSRSAGIGGYTVPDFTATMMERFW